MKTWLFPAMLGAAMAAEPVWIEGEDAANADVSRHPWYHGQVKRAELSGGGFVSHFDDGREGTATYEFEIAEAGEHELWLRANPVKSRLFYQLDDAAEKPVDFSQGLTGQVNLAADDKPDLRFMAWCRVGSFALEAGRHRLAFRFASEPSHHGSIDCFVLAPPGFKPEGVLKSGEIEQRHTELAKGEDGWLPWISQGEGETRISLRGLNERFAGESGRIVAKGPDFVREKTGEKVRFWAVNGPPHELKGEELAACARMLAERGVNLVRLHGKVFDETSGGLDRAKVEHIHEVVAAMKREGIYSHLSIYFPLWMKPKPGPGWREGYDGRQHPFALIFFEPEFQALHREWLAAVLEGLLDEPAVFGMELVNEDSLFFWTFAEKNVPDPQLRKLEKRFAAWAVERHGSIKKAIRAWGGMKHPRDGGGRLGFRGLLQGTNAVVHFALDSDQWSVKPRFFMQPWTLMSPTQAGQFPAAAAVYRMGLLREGEVVAGAALSLKDAVALKGSPPAPAANLDELRKADLPVGEGRRATGIDPRVHFLGRTRLTVGKGESRAAKVLAEGIDESGELLVSTTRELALDYGKGVLRLRAPAVQGAVGALAGEELDFPDLKIRTSLEFGAVVAVALDGKRIRDSERILVQVMSEENANGFRTADLGGGRKRIESIGKDPWMVRKFAGEVELLRADAGELEVAVLDCDGRWVEGRTGAGKIELTGAFPYLLITSP